MDYELMVLGNGNDAIEGSLSGARQSSSVALVLSNGAPRENISIKMLNQARANLIDVNHRQWARLREEATRLARQQRTEDLSKLRCYGVDVYTGLACFLDPHTVKIQSDCGELSLSASNLLIACGTMPARPAHLQIDDNRVLDPGSLLLLDELPASMIVVGAGQTGLDYALLLRSLGVEVTVIDGQTSPRDVYGGLMHDARFMELQSLDVAFRLDDEVIGVETRGTYRAAVRLASGKVFTPDAVLVCVGRIGATEELNLEAAGVGVDERGRIWCDADGGTWASHIRAIGDVVGFRATSALAG